jgi:mono/diheme cytochrome c family protein
METSSHLQHVNGQILLSPGCPDVDNQGARVTHGIDVHQWLVSSWLLSYILNMFLADQRMCVMKSIGNCLVVLILAAALKSLPASAADPAHGEQVARRWCASCHVVAPDQRQASSEAPPFSTVARNPNFNADRLAFFLLDPHPKMPNMSLTRTEATDLAAYIASLAR